ncbi:hypothetical protein Cgig2_015448 [Carnegiea gigantea]|uniref:TPX2 C-terminal domain-containing protein n=1 Tax=Carnegiea gigantea TaxID=171969 RepID=A0A9Q1Q9C9_9CARY|nr:hypothetical protein Cgig2_015448 [Carnegiea gigantea]
MAESTFVIPPFSYTSPAFSSETLQEENPSDIYGVEESVSFGRFMSDNLAWERWSSFNSNRNRYVEEAEKYSKPGSVAQKKAYFEAHFKRMAALKAAALLEQEGAGVGDPVTGTGTGTGDETGVNNDESGSCCHDTMDYGVRVQIQAHDSSNKGGDSAGVEGFVVHQNELYSAVVGTEEELRGDNNVEVVETAMDEKLVEQSVVLKDENFKGSDKELCGNGIAYMDKPPLQQKTNLKEAASAPVVKKHPPLSSFMSTVDGKGKGAPPLFTSSPAKSATIVHPGKENYATPMKNTSSAIADPDKKRTPLRASINREFNRILSPVLRKIGSSSKTSKDCSTPLRTPVKGSVDGVPEPPPLTPDITKRGSHHDSFVDERKRAAPIWHILSDGFKSPSNNRNKISSPIIPTSFCLRGRERATKRKQKLEDKFNATATEKAPLSLKFKEKAEAELSKFRQSFCFKVMSSPDHYAEAESQNKVLFSAFC